MDYSTLAVLFPLVLLLLGLGFTVVIDPYIRREHRRIMLTIVALCFSLIVQNYWENELFVRHTDLPLKNALSAYGYSVRPVFLLLFLSIVHPEGKKWPRWALVGINAALYCSSPYTKLCFEIREFDFAALEGPLWFSCTLVSGILLLWLLIQTIARFQKTQKLEQLIPVSVAVMIAASVAMDMRVEMEPQPVSFLTIAIVVGSVFYYVWLHLQFVRQHESELMAFQRIQIMMTQIQPHFLFNALNTIRVLYSKNPPLADKTLEDFSAYLRQNLESLKSPELIPVTNELEHTRLYAEIEMLRFPNVRLEYCIEDRDFSIPPLTIQPLVENAIRHGVRSRADGLVTVSTLRVSGAHHVTVQDNGVGFDTGKQESIPDTHIGLRNVKERVEHMCGGTMMIHSEIGAGTCITLIIPCGSERNRKLENRQ